MDKLINKRNLGLVYNEFISLLESVKLFDSEQIINDKNLLREKNEEYLNHISKSNKGIWIMNLELKNLYLNERSEELFGYKAKDMIGSYLYSFMKDDESEQRALEKFLEVRFYDARRVTYGHTDGRSITVDLEVKELYDENGNKKGTLGIFTEVV